MNLSTLSLLKERISSPFPHNEYGSTISYHDRVVKKTSGFLPVSTGYAHEGALLLHPSGNERPSAAQSFLTSSNEHRSADSSSARCSGSTPAFRAAASIESPCSVIAAMICTVFGQIVHWS